MADLQDAGDMPGIQALSVRYLGRNGLITRFLRDIAKLPKEERPSAGKKANAVKKDLEQRFKAAIQQAQQAADGRDERLDVSLPGRTLQPGALHPVSQINDEICTIFKKMGFDVAEGPEVEHDYYNFEALNFPKDHPARDMQDTFFVSEQIVLRTHTSPLQVRIMEKTDQHQ